MKALSPEADTLRPLPSVLAKGLIPVTIAGLLSFFTSTALFLFLTYRLISWRRYNRDQHTNQFVVLIYNLLFADIQQALAFLLNANSLRRDGIFVGNALCWAQGWFVSTGDLASSVFISAIGIHTLLAVVLEVRLPRFWFYAWIAACWLFVYFLALIGPVIHGDDFYARATYLCWINVKYNSLRLWLHYFWIFVFMFSTVLVYLAIFAYLARRKRRDPSFHVPHGVRPIILCYPLIYVICTCPIATGRIATPAGRHVPLEYFCVAATMIASNGWLDVLLYSLTRADLVFSEAPPSEETGLETFGILGYGRAAALGNTTTIECLPADDAAGGGSGGGGGPGPGSGPVSGRGSRMGGRVPRLRNGIGMSMTKSRRSDSVEKLYGSEAGIGMDVINVKGEVVVKSRHADERELRQIELLHGRKQSLSELSSTKSVDGLKQMSD